MCIFKDNKQCFSLYSYIIIWVFNEGKIQDYALFRMLMKNTKWENTGMQKAIWKFINMYKFPQIWPKIYTSIDNLEFLLESFKNVFLQNTWLLQGWPPVVGFPWMQAPVSRVCVEWKIYKQSFLVYYLKNFLINFVNLLSAVKTNKTNIYIKFTFSI